MNTSVKTEDGTICMATNAYSPGEVFIYLDNNDATYRTIPIAELVKMVRTLVASQQ